MKKNNPDSLQKIREDIRQLEIEKSISASIVFAILLFGVLYGIYPKENIYNVALAAISIGCACFSFWQNFLIRKWISCEE